MWSSARRASRWLLLALAACAAPRPAPDVEPASASGSASTARSDVPPRPIDLRLSSFDFAANPALAKRIADSPHGFFRFINDTFASEVCARVGTKRYATVWLHGDAHVEQYAVTSLGRALVDFDDTAKGPFILDLARFSTSLVLASRVRGEQRSNDVASRRVRDFLAAYGRGLVDPKLPATPPPFLARFEGKFDLPRSKFLESAEQAMVPLEPTRQAEVRALVARYAETEAAEGRRREPGFFEVKKLGGLTLGIGSALEPKYLVRLEGPAPSPDDDVILELKRAQEATPVPCEEVIPGGAALARRSQQDQAGDVKLLVPLRVPGSIFWVNEWMSRYEEVRIKRLEPPDLDVIAVEAGIMLAMQHQKRVGGLEPERPVVEPDVARDVETLAFELADATEAAYADFRSRWEAATP
jgi:hypothetical protein